MAESEKSDLMREFRKKILARKSNPLSRLIHTEVDITLTAREIAEGSEAEALEQNIVRRGQVVSVSDLGDIWLMSDSGQVEVIPQYNIAYISVVDVSPEYFTKSSAAPRISTGKSIRKQF